MRSAIPAIPEVQVGGGGGPGGNLNISTNLGSINPQGREGNNMQVGSMTSTIAPSTQLPPRDENDRIEVDRVGEGNAEQTSNSDPNNVPEASLSATTPESPRTQGSSQTKIPMKPFERRTFPNPCNCFASGQCPRLPDITRIISLYTTPCQVCISQFCGKCAPT